MLLCVLVEGFFSGSEIAVVSVNRAHLHHLVEKGSKSARLLNEVLAKPEWFLASTLMGTNLSTITLNAVATYFVVQSFGAGYEYYTILVTAPLMLVFGEVIPKVFYQRYADSLAFHLVYPLRFFSWILSPLIFLLARFSALLSRLTPKGKSPLLTREELLTMYRTRRRRRDEKDLERRMIDRIFSFSDQQAKDIMIPLVQVVSVRADSTVAQTTRIMRRSGYSRIPVYSDRVYNIDGWVNQYDLLLNEDPGASIESIMRKVRYVPASILLDRLLLDMQRAGDSLVVVVDEYGGAIGIVTMEDILEEVVGEIEDEFDRAPTDVYRPEPNQLVVSGRISIDQLNEHLSHPIPRGRV